MYDKSILAKSTGASLGVVAIVGLLFLSTGTAFATPVAGIGGFTIEANSITGDNLILYPGTSEAENTSNINPNASTQGPGYQDQYPVGIVELTNTEIDGLELTKVFNLSKYSKPTAAAPALIPGQARIKIRSDAPENVTTNSIIIKTPQIAADKAKFSGLEIKENTVEDPGEITSWLELRTQEDADSPIPDEGAPVQYDTKYNFSGGSSPGLILQDPFIRATYLATDSITIPDLRLEVQYNPDGDDVYEYAS
ncbi:hypothetical protein [Halorientalis pallida]|uniref:Uncharacterized protein n=1 Tax=Halorientalis pallida TaxID=2479928 RepID=A0A498KSX0_9EURY|nr:hypothetical protein [Halorientalis pallida]RXK46278.1 hypothetical protein EAF64_19560 [Halorientalis pallida]